jgi:hypothetical protein
MHMRKNVDVSIQRTVARLGELSEDLDKSRELFETLVILQSMKNRINHEIPGAQNEHD